MLSIESARTCSTEPSANYAVALACDRNYFPYALCVANSLYQQEGSHKYDIFIVNSDGCKLPSQISIPNLVVLDPKGPNPFASLGARSRHGLATYLRLLVPSLLDHNYKKVLFLDSDIAVAKPLSAIFDIDLGSRCLGAVRDNLQWRTPRRQMPEFQERGLPWAAYFNAGVLLLDVEKFNGLQILEKAVAIATSQRSRLSRNDQSLLNILFHKNWVEISPVWNWQYTWSSRLFADFAEPVIYHFIGRRKPWNDQQARLPQRFRKTFYDFVDEFFPDSTSEMITASRHEGCKPEKLKRTFLKHALCSHSMFKYLDRFSHPLDSHLA